MEEWRDIPGYDGYYQISNQGRVRSKDRYARVCGGGQRLVKGRVMALTKATNGYPMINLSYKRVLSHHLVHRLVAQAFIPNPNNYPQVNHKDENITNNCVDNLEWCTAKYNANYGTRNQRCNEKVKKKPVKQIDLDGNVVRVFCSIKEAMRTTGADESQIIRCCTGRNNTARGFRWEYV